MAPWKLPLVCAAIAVPIIAAFLVGGPGVGAAIGGLAAVGIVFFAVSQSPRGGIGTASRRGAVQKLLVVVADPLEDPAAVEQVSRAVTGRSSEVVVLAPASIGFLDRWASDVEAARRAAQRRLVLSVAALAAAGIEAEARVGDEDVVQAVEDQLGRFEATEVILVSADGDSKTATAAAEELRSRLRTGFRWIVTGPADR